MKIVKNILLVLWCIFCTIGIVRNFSHYDFVDWIIIFFVITVPILLIILIFRPRNDKVFQVPSSGLIQTETEQSKDYIETQNLVMHTDNSEISDSEVLKLMQDGFIGHFMNMIYPSILKKNMVIVQPSCQMPLNLPFRMRKKVKIIIKK